MRQKKAPDPQSEDFLKSMKVENIDSLKEKIREDLKVRKEQENQNSKRQQVTQKILEIPEFALPQQAVEDESKNIFQGNIQRALQSGAKEDEIEKKRDEIWKQSQVQAEARIKLTITLGRIAEKEKVEVSNEDLAQAATREAMMLLRIHLSMLKSYHRIEPDLIVSEWIYCMIRLWNWLLRWGKRKFANLRVILQTDLILWELIYHYRMCTKERDARSVHGIFTVVC